MTASSPRQKPEREKKRFYLNGRLYFSKNSERKFFFFLTLAMLLWGILVKLELF